MTSVLVIGGTGPSGPPLVERLLTAGFTVTIYHTGGHEVAFSKPVEHLHGDPRDEADITAKFAGRRWDITISTSGRMRALAALLAGKTDRFVGITGQPVYLGASQPTPKGALALPVPEQAPRQYDAAGYTGKVAAGEDQLMEQHRRGDFEAVMFFLDKATLEGFVKTIDLPPARAIAAEPVLRRGHPGLYSGVAPESERPAGEPAQARRAARPGAVHQR